MIPIIGIVGGIGSGKSLVANAMQVHGGSLINADQMGHEALEQPDIRAKLIERWGDAIVAGDSIDRKKLGRIVFADVRELRALEAIVFPFIEKRILDEIALARTKPGVKCIILDAAIMIETGWHRHCDKIVFVEAPREMRLDRLKRYRGWSAEELERREKVQLPLEEKQRHAQAVIHNDGDPDKVVRQVKDLLVLWKVIC